MTTITKFLAYDGTELTDSEQCAKYEAIARRADEIMEQFPPRPDGCDFSNGDGYIQHGSEVFYKVRRELLELAKSEWNHEWFQQSIDDETIHASWAYRLISDGLNKTLSNAWYRILCTDPDLREWGQPYYANYPSDAKQHQINA